MFYAYPFVIGYTLPLPSLAVDSCHFYDVCPSQLSPCVYKIFLMHIKYEELADQKLFFNNICFTSLRPISFSDCRMFLVFAAERVPPPQVANIYGWVSLIFPTRWGSTRWAPFHDRFKHNLPTISRLISALVTLFFVPCFSLSYILIWSEFS